MKCFEQNVISFPLHRSIVTVLVTAIMVGQTVSAAPDYRQAKRAADRAFHLLGSVPSIDSYSDAGVKPVRELLQKRRSEDTEQDSGGRRDGCVPYGIQNRGVGAVVMGVVLMEYSVVDWDEQ